MRISYKLGRIQRIRRIGGILQAIWFELQWTLRFPRVRIQLTDFPSSLVLRRFSSDYFVFATVFLHHELDLNILGVTSVIDAGANVGFTTAYLAKKYPKALIIAIEPDRANCELLRLNTQGFSNVKIIEGAIWPRSEMLTIENPTDESWSFRMKPGNAGAAVTGYTVQQILNLAGFGRCDLLKLDIEGAEKELFDHSSIGLIWSMQSSLKSMGMQLWPPSRDPALNTSGLLLRLVRSFF
jgi:FkbM family methyltransferase